MPVKACRKRIADEDLAAVFCCCVCFATPVTLITALNVLLTDWLTSFDADHGSAVAVQAVCSGVSLGGGLLAGILERKMGARVSLVLGSVLASLGLFSGGFAPSLPVLIFCVGVLTGSGVCLLHLSSVSCAMKRFPKRVAFVLSIMTCTSGIAHLGSPLLYRYLSDLYTWRGTLIVASGIMLHTALSGLVLTSPFIIGFAETSPKPPRSFSSTAAQPSDADPFSKSPDGVTEGEEDKALLDSETSPRSPISGYQGGTRLDSAAAAKFESMDELAVGTALVSRKTSATAVDGTAGRKNCNLESDEVTQLIDSPETGCDVVYEVDGVAGRIGGEYRVKLKGQEVTDSKDKVDLISVVDDVQDASSSKELSVMPLSSSEIDIILGVAVKPLHTQIQRKTETSENDQNDELFTRHQNPDLETPAKGDDNVDGFNDRSDKPTRISQARSSEGCGPAQARNDPEPKTAEKPEDRKGDLFCQRCVVWWGANAAFLTNPIYLSVLTCVTLVLPAISCFVFLVMDFTNHKGWTLNDGLFLNFVFFLSSLIGRGLVGVISLWKRVHCVALMVGCALIGSFGLCLIGQVSSFGLVCFMYTCMAAGSGGTVVMIPSTLLTSVGPERSALAMGLSCTVEGILGTATSIATGVLVAYFGTYRWLTLVYGIISVASSVNLLLVFLCHNPKQPVPSRQTV